MSQITEKEYREYLIVLIPLVWKILPLYEEKNEHLVDYIDSVCTEVKGIKKIIGSLPSRVWHDRVLAILEQLKEEVLLDQHKKIKKETFKITSLIDKQIDELKGV
ncbi:hypothetical protein [Bacillus sp. FJAT-22090]|uniref:hypothetical protein n=1 Tax=Bacillus sp. FJAT-22090 TaxID=1581038 RepID=UPI0011AAF7DD|nr:hypothetical protein [Bacillus sp. FJAT-22090]